MKTQRHIVLGVTGSISAYKAAELASQLTQKKFHVDVVLTQEAQKFITPLTFSALTHRAVLTSLWEENPALGCTHIEWADRAHLVIVAPATAHTLAQMAHGFAADALGAILLATHAPVLVAPAMNGKMWLHPATQANVSLLRKRGVEVLGPEEGLLACGYEGTGRLCSLERIIHRAMELLT